MILTFDVKILRNLLVKQFLGKQHLKDGILIISTPNRLITSPDGKFSNPDHIREFDLKEFTDILKVFFSQVIIYGQSVSRRVKQAEECRKNNLRLISKLPEVLKSIFPAKFKESLLKKYHYFVIRVLKKIDEEKIDEKDFLISLNNMHQARYFIAICKKTNSLGKI